MTILKKNIFFVIFFCFWFGCEIKCSLVDTPDAEFIESLNKVVFLNEYEKAVKTYFSSSFSLNSLSYPFFDSAVATCNRYPNVLITGLVDPGYTIKTGFWRFITLLSSEEFATLDFQINALANNQEDQVQSIKKCGNIIKTHFTGFQEIFKKYIMYACPTLEDQNIFKNRDEKYGIEIYDLITKQFFGNEINEEIYKKWRKKWVEITKVTCMVEQLKEFGVNEWKDVFEGQNYKEEPFKEYYKKRHQFDWIKVLKNDAISRLYFWLQPAFALWDIYKKLGITDVQEEPQAIRTEKELKRHYLELVIGYKLPALRIFLLHSVPVEKLEEIINEILASKKSGEEIMNNTIELRHCLYIEYLATNNEKIKNLLLKIIKKYAEKDIGYGLDLMRFDITEHQWQVNKEIKKICDRLSLLNENEINALRKEAKNIVLEVQKKEKKHALIKIMLMGFALGGVTALLWAKIWGIE